MLIYYMINLNYFCILTNQMWAGEPSKPNKVKVYGPGVEKGVKTNRPTHFTVDCTGAGNG